MKVFIWLVCIFIPSAITTFFRLNGIFLGAIPTIIIYSISIFIAKKLCEHWDTRKEIKNHCKEITGNASELKLLLDSYVVNEKIEQEYADRLLKRYSQGNELSLLQKMIAKFKNSNLFRFTNDLFHKRIIKKKKILFCRKCGSKLAKNSKFCCKCGTMILEEVDHEVL